MASVPGRLPVRVASPWHAEHPTAEVSARPFRCPLSTRLMEPLGFTAVGWHGAQEAAVTGAATATCPVGGMPWHEVQVSGAVSVQTGDALAPVTPAKPKFPWQ